MEALKQQKHFEEEEPEEEKIVVVSNGLILSRLFYFLYVFQQAPVKQEVPEVAQEIETKEVETYEDEETEITLEDTGLIAVALYDYQAAAEDEISFDPDDVITHVEMVRFVTKGVRNRWKMLSILLSRGIILIFF